MPTINVRSIPVKAGDVFGGCLCFCTLVVLSVDGKRANVRNADTGRRTRIMVRRLQAQSPRASEREAKAAHAALARMDKQATQSRPAKRPRRQTRTPVVAGHACHGE